MGKRYPVAVFGWPLVEIHPLQATLQVAVGSAFGPPAKLARKILILKDE